MTVRGHLLEDDPPYKNPKNIVNPQISYGQSYQEWDAAISCGATLTELMEWDSGEKFTPRFKAKVGAFAWVKKRIGGYIEDARVVKPKKGK